MRQRFHQGLIGILYRHVFADDSDLHLAFRFQHALDHLIPARQIGRARIIDTENLQHLRVETFCVIARRRVVDGFEINRWDDALGPYITELRDLLAVFHRDMHIGTAKQHIGLNADTTKFLHRMLCRFGFQFASTGDVGHQR